MSTGHELLAEPTKMPVTLVEARDQCDLAPDSCAHDRRLTLHILAASEYVGKVVGRSFTSSQWRLSQAAFTNPIYLPLSPLVSVEQVTYLDEDNVRQVVPTTTYEVVVSREPGYVVLASGETWPSAASSPDSVQVDYTAGYGTDPSDVSAVAKMAILQLVRHQFDNAGPVITGSIAGEIPLTLRTLVHNLDRGEVL